MRATFEEKTYENYFNSELATQTQVFFPWGQVQEGVLGFDSSAFSRNRGLWRRLGYPFWLFPPFVGVDLREIADEMEHYLSIEIEHVPRMTSNLLFQYKRPEYMKKPLSSEWEHWNRKYYRYDIYREQQDLLMHIHSSFQSQLLILYAAPTIHDVDKLVEAYLARQVVACSNFTEASFLGSHERNTYIQAGRFSIACSEPERLANYDLLKMLEGKPSNENTEKSATNRDFVINFRKQFISVVYEHRFYSKSLRGLNEAFAKVERYPLFYSFVAMHNFRLLTGMQWLIKTEA